MNLWEIINLQFHCFKTYSQLAMFWRTHADLFLQHPLQFKMLVLYVSRYIIQILFLNLHHVRLPYLPHFSSVQSLSCVSLWPYELQHARPPCPSPTPGVHPNPSPSSRWFHPLISPSVVPSLLPSNFPSVRFFSNESALHIRWPKYVASASVLSMNIQHWFPLGLKNWFPSLSYILLKHMLSKVSLLNTCVSDERLLSCFSWVRLCNPMDCSPPGSSVHGIPQAKMLEWLGMSSSKGSSKVRDQTSSSYISCIGRCVLYY